MNTRAAAAIWVLLSLLGRGLAQESAPSQDPFAAWCARFEKVDSLRVVWKIQIRNPAAKWEGAPLIIDTLMVWPSGVRETVKELDPKIAFSAGGGVIPDEWGARVLSATVFGGDVGYVCLMPRNGSFDRQHNSKRWLLSEHAPDWGFRNEWVLARWAAVGGSKQWHDTPPSIADGDYVYQTPTMSLRLHRQADGVWSLAEYRQSDSSGWTYRITSYSDWKDDSSMGWVPGSVEIKVFSQREQTTPDHIEQGTLLWIAAVPEVPANALVIDLKDATTHDHDSRIVYDANGTKVGVLASSGASAGWRWGTVAAIIAAVAAVAGGGGYYIRKRMAHAGA